MDRSSLHECTENAITLHVTVATQSFHRTPWTKKRLHESKESSEMYALGYIVLCWCCGSATMSFVNVVSKWKKLRIMLKVEWTRTLSKSHTFVHLCEYILSFPLLCFYFTLHCCSMLCYYCRSNAYSIARERIVLMVWIYVKIYYTLTHNLF